MTAKQQTRYLCDLCKEAATVEGVQKPKGWVEVNLEGPIDRSWTDIHICGRCLGEIDAAKKRHGIK